MLTILLPIDCIHSEDSSGYIIRGEWRQVAEIGNNVLQPVSSLTGNRSVMQKMEERNSSDISTAERVQFQGNCKMFERLAE